jgi:membrane protease YdiL (CAAX protease family)
MNTERRRAALALLLLVPVPTLGVLTAMWWWPGPPGRAVYFLGKAWILALPALWLLLVDRKPIGWSRPMRGGFGLGLSLGVVSATVIVATAWMLRDRIDVGLLRTAVEQMGLADPARFLIAGLGWTLVNSLLEEYVWRWFVTSRWIRLVPPAAAIGLSAACFTLHHVVATSFYLPPALVALASTGVFVGGAVWSWLWWRTGSIWPAWLAHILADAAIFGVGYWLLFR